MTSTATTEPRLPLPATIGYTVEAEQWYADTLPQLPPGHGQGVYAIRGYTADDDCLWEFSIVAHHLSDTQPALRVEVFDDAFAAFAAIPSFFIQLADLGLDVSADQIRALMDSLGWSDRTKRSCTEMSGPC